MSTDEMIAALGMCLIICGVVFFLARDMRGHLRQLDDWIYSLERRSPYVRWFSPGFIAAGILLIFVGFVLGFL